MTDLNSVCHDCGKTYGGHFGLRAHCRPFGEPTFSAAPSIPLNVWIPWEGGKRPVPRDAGVHVRLRDKTNVIASAYELSWAIFGDGADIVAYMVTELPGERPWELKVHSVEPMDGATQGNADRSQYTAVGGLGTMTIKATKPAPDLNAAMIARDGPARKVPVLTPKQEEFHRGTRESGAFRVFPSFHSPDLVPSSHQIDPGHALRAVRG
jgi:hypothetical protein